MELYARTSLCASGWFSHDVPMRFCVEGTACELVHGAVPARFHHHSPKCERPSPTGRRPLQDSRGRASLPPSLEIPRGWNCTASSDKANLSMCAPRERTSSDPTDCFQRSTRPSGRLPTARSFPSHGMIPTAEGASSRTRWEHVGQEKSSSRPNTRDCPSQLAEPIRARLRYGSSLRPDRCQHRYTRVVRLWAYSLRSIARQIPALRRQCVLFQPRPRRNLAEHIASRQ